MEDSRSGVLIFHREVGNIKRSPPPEMLALREGFPQRRWPTLDARGKMRQMLPRRLALER